MNTASNKEKIRKIITINVFISWIIFSVVAFAFDGYVLHPIPNKGNENLDLSDTNTIYCEAKILDKSHLLQVGEIFLVDHENEIHLLYFRGHFPTGRYAFVSDVIIKERDQQAIVIDKGPEAVIITVENNTITNCSYRYAPAMESSIYIFFGLLCTVFESMLLWLLVRYVIKKH